MPPAPAVALRAAGTAVVGLAAALLVIAYLRLGADWPAQDYRAFLAQQHVFVWTNGWYGGSALPGYSVLYPPLAALVGSSVVGVASVAVAGFFAAWLAPAGRAAWRFGFLAACLLCLLECLVIGQVTFLLGVAFAVPALALLPEPSARRVATTTVLAALCSLASPLAGLFLVLGGVAMLRTLGWRRVLPLVAALAGTAAAAVFDEGGGPFSYHWETLGAIAICCVLIVALSTRDDRGLRDFAVVYLVVAAAAFAYPNPVGANLNRLGKLVVLPLAIGYLARRPLPTWRRVGGVVAAGLAAWWSLIPASTAYRYGIDDPGRHGAYYAGLVRFLATQDPRAGRVEVPFTRTHSESYRVARAFPLARGWERQVDLAQNDVLYHRLTAASYRRWLDDNAVSLVAVSSLIPDVGGAPEYQLLLQRPSYLHLVWADAHWRVWRVEGSRPLADGPARVTGLSEQAVRLHFARAGTSVVRVRANPLWTVSAGDARLARATGGWLRVSTDRAQTVVLRARLTTGLLDPGAPVR